MKNQKSKLTPNMNDLSASEITEMLRVIPPADDYGQWLVITSAVFSALPPEQALPILISWSAERIPGEYAAKYASRLQRVGVGTLVHIARKHGWRGVARPHQKPYPARSRLLTAATAALPLPAWLSR